jgi:hypothetical protein
MRMRFYLLVDYSYLPIADRSEWQYNHLSYRSNTSLEEFKLWLDRENQRVPLPPYIFVPTSCVRKIFGELPTMSVRWPDHIPIPKV